MKYPALLFAFGTLLSAETFPARLDKPLWPDRDGGVEINDQGIALGEQPEAEPAIRLAGREYRFTIKQGKLSDALFAMISNHLKRPVTDRVRFRRRA